MPVPLLDYFAHCFREIFRQRCFEIHPAFLAWVVEAKFPSMQHLPRELSGTFSAIKRVTEDRISKVLQMDANLVSSAAVQPAFKQARRSARAHDFEIGSRDPSAFARNRHLLAMNAMTHNRRDDASGSTPRFPGNKRQVDLVDRARRELPRKISVRKIVLRHYQTTARSFIQAMNNARPFLSADPGKILAMRKQSVNQRAAFAAGTRMNGNSRGFVYHDEIVIFKQNGDRDLFRDEIDRFHRRLDHGNKVACSNQVTRTGTSSVHCYMTLPNKRLNSRPGKFRRHFSQKTIQSRAGIHWRDIEFAAVSLSH